MIQVVMDEKISLVIYLRVDVVGTSLSNSMDKQIRCLE